jgi:hypothetical protein
MELKCASQTSVDFKRTTWSYILEDRTLHNHRCEHLKSYIDHVCLKTEYLLQYVDLGMWK